MELNTEIKKITDPIYQKISKVIPEIEWAFHAPLIHKINILKKEKNAVVLAHNYQTPEIFHGIADIAADSLALAVEAKKTDADIIVLCGVHFMAETAKLMNPSKKILLPDMGAGCSLAASITGKDVRMLKEKYPSVPVVTYVNTSAEVKAESDICCTSANAVRVVESLGVDKVIFLPDQYMAKYVQTKTKVQIISWVGTCIVHERFSAHEIKDIKKHYGEVDEAFVAIVVKNLGPSIYKKDAETVACSDPKELDTVRKNFLMKKLGIDASKSVLDAAIQDVCTELKGVRTKYRATFYYALAKKFKKESVLS